MLSIMLTLLPIFAIMLLGALAEYRRILHCTTASIINQFVYYFSLPILLFYIMAQVDSNDISWRPVVGFLAGTGISQIALNVLARLSGKNTQDAIMAGLVSSFPNAAFMGIPMVILVFPDNTTAEIYAGIAALLPTFAIIYTDTSLEICNTQKVNTLTTIKNIFCIIGRSPQMIGASLGLIVSLGEFSLPNAIEVAAKMIGNTAAPCALFCIGMTLAAQITQWSQSITTNTKQKKSWKLQTALISTKLLICPLLVFFVCYALDAGLVPTASMTIIAAMPTAIICYVIAEKHNAFVQESIITIVIGTILSCLTIPFIISLLL